MRAIGESRNWLRLLVCAIGLGAAFVSDAKANQTIDWGPYIGLGLAKGVTANDIYVEPKPSCITFQQADLPSSHMTATASIVFNAEQYSHALHVDASVKGTYGPLSASAKAQTKETDAFSDSSFDIILEIDRDTVGKTLNNVDWDARHKPMIATGTPDALNQVRVECGDRYVASEFDAARLFLVIKISKSQRSSLSERSGSVSAQYGVPVANVSASLGGDETVSDAHQQGTLSFSLVSFGFKNAALGAIGIAARSGGGLEAIAEQLGTYAAKLDEDRQPVKFELARLPYPASKTDDLDNPAFESSLIGLAHDMDIDDERIANINSLLTGDPRHSLYLSPQNADASLTKLRQDIQTHIDALQSAHQTCRQALQYSACQQAIALASIGPPHSPLELPPNLQPGIGPYVLSVDGQLAADTKAILSNLSASTLFDAVRTTHPSAKNVDILAPLSQPYTSYIEFLAQAPPNHSILPANMGGLRVAGTEFVVPDYFPPYEREANVIRLIHADAAAPCHRSFSGLISFNDDQCLTNAGKAWRDALRVSMGLAVSDPTPFTPQGELQFKTFQYAAGAIIGNCFGPALFTPIANSNIRVSKPTVMSPTDPVTSVLYLQLLFFGDGPEVIGLSEAHSFQEWQNTIQIATNQFISRSQSLQANDTLCGAHVQ